MPFCPNCGHEVAVTAWFCENCRGNLPVLNIPSTPPPPPSVVERKVRHRSLKILIIIIIAAAVSIIGILFGIFLMPKTFVTKSLYELLLTKGDLSTERIIGNTTTMSISATGFSKGIKLALVKTGLGVESAVVKVYRFSSSDSTNQPMLELGWKSYFVGEVPEVVQVEMATSERSPYVSVVIPAYNEERYLPLCLESLRNQDYAGDYEIIVVDNTSTDNTPEVALAMGAKVV